MSIECGCDPDYYVDLRDNLVVSTGTEFCVECRRLIPMGEEHYIVEEQKSCGPFDELSTCGTFTACEACGDLALSWLALGFCWQYGGLRSDIEELNSYA